MKWQKFSGGSILLGDISSGKTWGAYKVNMRWCCAVVAKTKRIIIIELGNLQKKFCTLQIFTPEVLSYLRLGILLS